MLIINIDRIYLFYQINNNKNKPYNDMKTRSNIASFLTLSALLIALTAFTISPFCIYENINIYVKIKYFHLKRKIKRSQLHCHQFSKKNILNIPSYSINTKKNLRFKPTKKFMEPLIKGVKFYILNFNKKWKLKYI